MALQATDTDPFEFCAPTLQSQMVTFRAMRWNIIEPGLALTIDGVDLIGSKGLTVKHSVLVPARDPSNDDGGEFGGGYGFPPTVSPSDNQDWEKRVDAVGAKVESGTGPIVLYLALQRTMDSGASTGVQIRYHDAKGSAFTADIPASYRVVDKANDTC